MAYVDKINVQGTDYDINDKRLPKVNDVVTLNDNFTANSIIEKMSGYSATLETQIGWTIENVFTSVVKNGNKLTLVVALNLTKTADDAYIFIDLAEIAVPGEVWNRLYPTNVGGSNFLDNKLIQAFSSFNTSVSSYGYLSKREPNKVGIVGYLDNLVKDTTYYWRYEATFLLSDNLISQ